MSLSRRVLLLLTADALRSKDPAYPAACEQVKRFTSDILVPSTYMPRVPGQFPFRLLLIFRFLYTSFSFFKCFHFSVPSSLSDLPLPS